MGLNTTKMLIQFLSLYLGYASSSSGKALLIVKLGAFSGVSSHHSAPRGTAREPLAVCGHGGAPGKGEVLGRGMAVRFSICRAGRETTPRHREVSGWFTLRCEAPAV